VLGTYDSSECRAFYNVGARNDTVMHTFEDVASCNVDKTDENRQTPAMLPPNVRAVVDYWNRKWACRSKQTATPSSSLSSSSSSPPLHVRSGEMIVSHTYRFVFVNVPKSASSTIRKLLAQVRYV
jgi:hypothetical protein